MGLTVAIFVPLILFCLAMAAFPGWFGKLGVRMMASAPDPVRRFYSTANLGRPIDGPFWNNYRRVGGLLVGLALLALLMKFAVR